MSALVTDELDEGMLADPVMVAVAEAIGIDMVELSLWRLTGEARAAVAAARRASWNRIFCVISVGADGTAARPGFI